MEKLRKFLELSLADRRLLVRAWLLLLAVRLGSGLLPFHRQRRIWPRLLAAATGGAAATGEANRIAWAVPLASRYVPGATCLTQALALKILLNRGGKAGELRLGVAKDDEGRMMAHAWVEQDGQVLIGGRGLEDFTPLKNLESFGPSWALKC